MEKEQQEIKKAAKEMEKREKQGNLDAMDGHKIIDPSTQLWTVRYAPQHVKDICGNKSQVEKLQQWLRDWHVAVLLILISLSSWFATLQGVQRKMWV